MQYIEGDMYSHLDSATNMEFICVAFNCTFIGCIFLWYIQSEYVKVSSTETEWVGVSREFQQIWNFPNCIGMDILYIISIKIIIPLLLQVLLMANMW